MNNIPEEILNAAYMITSWMKETHNESVGHLVDADYVDELHDNLDMLREDNKRLRNKLNKLGGMCGEIACIAVEEIEE